MRLDDNKVRLVQALLEAVRLVAAAFAGYFAGGQ